MNFEKKNNMTLSGLCEVKRYPIYDAQNCLNNQDSTHCPLINFSKRCQSFIFQGPSLEGTFTWKQANNRLLMVSESLRSKLPCSQVRKIEYEAYEDVQALLNRFIQRHADIEAENKLCVEDFAFDTAKAFSVVAAGILSLNILGILACVYVKGWGCQKIDRGNLSVEQFLSEMEESGSEV